MTRSLVLWLAVLVVSQTIAGSLKLTPLRTPSVLALNERPSGAGDVADEAPPAMEKLPPKGKFAKTYISSRYRKSMPMFPGGIPVEQMGSAYSSSMGLMTPTPEQLSMAYTKFFGMNRPYSQQSGYSSYGMGQSGGGYGGSQSGGYGSSRGSMMQYGSSMPSYSSQYSSDGYSNGGYSGFSSALNEGYGPSSSSPAGGGYGGHGSYGGYGGYGGGSYGYGSGSSGYGGSSSGYGSGGSGGGGMSYASSPQQYPFDYYSPFSGPGNQESDSDYYMPGANSYRWQNGNSNNNNYYGSSYGGSGYGGSGSMYPGVMSSFNTYNSGSYGSSMMPYSSSGGNGRAKARGRSFGFPRSYAMHSEDRVGPMNGGIAYFDRGGKSTVDASGPTPLPSTGRPALFADSPASRSLEAPKDFSRVTPPVMSIL